MAPRTAPRSPAETDPAIRLHLLSGIHASPRLTQRRAAAELGVALGIVNAGLKTLVAEGLVRIETQGGTRYAYHLTETGRAERARLAAEAFARAFDPFRRARAQCAMLFAGARARGWTRIALLGRSPLVEAAVLSAAEAGVQVVGVIDANALSGETTAGLEVRADAKAFGAVHAVLVTDAADPDATYREARRHFPAERVLAPAMLGIRRESHAA